MADARLLLGVDGGNTKTVALAARPDGTIIGAGRATGSADIHAAPVETALGVIDAAIADALGSKAPAAIRSAAFSLAGADWPEDIELLGAMLGTRWPDAVVVNDAIGALRAAIPDGPGVVVVCGTGAATGARGPDGRTWHSSFWQEPQGARELGEQALLAVYRAELGIDPPTGLRSAVLAALGEPEVEAVLRRRTTRGPDRFRDPAVLAAVLLDTAESGDATARRIVVDHGRALGDYAVVAARRVGIADGAFPLALAGGVFRHPGTLMERAVGDSVAAHGFMPSLLRPSLEPAAGALLLAFDAAGVAVTADVEERLRESLPPVALFDTHPMAGRPAS
jgi:N-acetylglucosamine kinase-like BadF-type ATPase